MGGFDTIALWYDLLAGGPARVARENFLLRHALGPGQRVLDLACGTGLHARFFADLGASVTAVDLSETMLKAARILRNHPAIQWVRGSMLNPPSGTWNLVTCLGNSIALLESTEEIALFFSRTSGVLSPGGTLLVQLLNGHGSAWKTNQVREVHTRWDGKPVTIRKHWRFLEATDSAVNVLLTIERLDTLNDAPTDRIETRLRLWYPDLLDARAREAGLSPESRWGGMSGEPYVADVSSDFVALWRKPEAETPPYSSRNASG